MFLLRILPTLLLLLLAGCSIASAPADPPDPTPIITQPTVLPTSQVTVSTATPEPIETGFELMEDTLIIPANGGHGVADATGSTTHGYLSYDSGSGSISWRPLGLNRQTQVVYEPSSLNPMAEFSINVTDQEGRVLATVNFRVVNATQSQAVIQRVR